MTTRGTISFEYIPEKHGNCNHYYNDFLNVNISLEDKKTVNFIKVCKRCEFTRKTSKTFDCETKAKAFYEKMV